MEKITLTVQKRQITGRKIKSLRRDGIIPANIFGKKVDSMAVQLPEDVFSKAFAKSGETGIVSLTVDGETRERPVLISNLHLHPVTDRVLHVDFRQVDLTEKVTTAIPVELVGESPAEKDLGAVIVQMINELEVEALPADLPEKLEVDVTALTQFGQSLTVADIKVDTKKIEIQAEPEQVIVSALEPKQEVEEAPAPVEGETAEGEAAETPAEGETSATPAPAEKNE